MPIISVPRNGPPEAQTCPMLLCDACGARIHSDGARGTQTARPEGRSGNATWWERSDGPAQNRLESSPMFFVHDGHCDREFRKYAEQFYRMDDGWGDRWRPADDVFAQLGYNMAHPFEDDPELKTEDVLYFPPTRIVNLLPATYVIQPEVVGRG